MKKKKNSPLKLTPFELSTASPLAMCACGWARYLQHVPYANFFSKCINTNRKRHIITPKLAWKWYYAVEQLRQSCMLSQLVEMLSVLLHFRLSFDRVLESFQFHCMLSSAFSSAFVKNAIAYELECLLFIYKNVHMKSQ